MERERARAILSILKKEFDVPKVTRWEMDPFKVLIRTILSQSTSGVNTARAYKNLETRFRVKANDLAEGDLKEIEEAIRVGGLYRNKARIIREVSRAILERFGGSLDFIHKDELERARRILMELPGVGPKTCDVLLLFSAGRPVIPVDTHVSRVSKRLKLAGEKADYEETRRSLENLYLGEDHLAVHLAFIAHGRRYCKARRPLCGTCPLGELCPSREKLAS